jgi:hypothetical protein|tara:strand:- start:9 stop:191 length:183 start_codon:yes stop_codon:yes gene_type:complete
MFLSLNFVRACAVCYGAPDDPITQSLNTAILFMLGIVGFVLSCIVYGIFNLVKRSNEIKS